MKRRDFISKATGISAVASLPIADMFARVNDLASATPQAETNYDVIVLGVGSMGSSTCYHLARRGVKVLGIEQFDIPHELGSHAGQSRMIRKAYSEHPDYVPLLRSAYANWQAMEKEAGAELYFRTGILHIGKKESQDIAGLRKSASLYSIEVKDVSQAEMASRFPQFRIPSAYDIVLEPDYRYDQQADVSMQKTGHHRGPVGREDDFRVVQEPESDAPDDRVGQATQLEGI